MYVYLVRRVLWMVPTFVVILVITFAVMRFQAIPLAESISKGRGDDAGAQSADGRQLDQQMDGLLIKLRLTGRDLPAVINTRGFIGKAQVLAWLQQAERTGDLRHDAGCAEAELSLWAGGALLVEPLTEIIRDPALAKYHAPAVTALTFCAHRAILPTDEDHHGQAWVNARRDDNAILRRCRIAYTNSPTTGFATRDATASTKAATVLALVAAKQEHYDRSLRRWTALLGETGFSDFLVKLGTGQLYSDTKSKPVFELIADRWSISFAYNTLAIVLAWAIAIPLGIRSARRLGTVEDAITTQSLLILWSLPSFFIGTLLLHYLCTVWQGDDQVIRGGWFPNAGIISRNHEQFSTGRWMLDVMWHAALPLVVLCYGSFTALSRYMRGSVLDNIASDFARTARAKGVDEQGVIYRHVVPNSLITMITLGSGLLASLFGGSIVVELIFSIPGLGLLLLEAARAGDAPLIMGSTIISVGLLLIGILIADVLYALADPRVRARYA